MRRNELGCDARRGDEAMLDASRGAATPQRAQFVTALRVAAKCGARFVAALGKGVTIACGPLRAIIRIWLQRIPLSLLK